MIAQIIEKMSSGQLFVMILLIVIVVCITISSVVTEIRRMIRPTPSQSETTATAAAPEEP